MWPTSDRFSAMLRVPHLVAFRATIEQVGNDPVTVPIVGGNVSVDEKAATRRTGTLQIPWSLSAEAEAALGIDLRTLPFGAYAFVERGVRYADGTTELVPVGRLRINAVSWRTSEHVATLDLADRMAQLVDTLLAPWTPSGMTATEAIVYLVEAVYGATIGYEISTGAGEADLVDTTYEGTHADAIADLAESINAMAYFDAEGTFMLMPAIHEPAAVAVWDVDAGAEGVLVDADESLDRTGTYSEVIVRGQTAAGVAIESMPARDEDIASPTYWEGPFGLVSLVYDSSAVQTQAAADALAMDLLMGKTGLTRSMAIETVPNPALEIMDTVMVHFPDGREEHHMVSALTIPLDAAGSMAMATTCPGNTAMTVDDMRAQAALASWGPA